MMLSNSTVACGSRPEVGSSRIAICASFIRISASPSRWRMPRENVATRRSVTSASPTWRERSIDLLFALRPLESHQPRGIAQVLGGREIVVEADLVGQIADLALHLQRLAHRIMAEHAGLPVRDVAQAEQHQDGGGLAGAVRTEQPENLTARHLERDAFDDGRPVVAFGEILRFDDVVAHRRPNQTTEPIMTSNAPPMRAIPTMPQIVEVVTATRNDCDADSPRAAARTVVT